MKDVARACAVVLAVASLASAQTAEDEKIAQAVKALPESMRDGASVVEYDADGYRTILREGTNSLVCEPAWTRTSTRPNRRFPSVAPRNKRLTKRLPSSRNSRDVRRTSRSKRTNVTTSPRKSAGSRNSCAARPRNSAVNWSNCGVRRRRISSSPNNSSPGSSLKARPAARPVVARRASRRTKRFASWTMRSGPWHEPAARAARTSVPSRCGGQSRKPEDSSIARSSR